MKLMLAQKRVIILYIIRNGQYATAAVSKRDGNSTSISSNYLGKIIDEEQGIFWSRKRGLFKFDIETGEYSDAPDDISARYDPHDKNLDYISSTIFGDVYVLNEFLYKSGLMSVIDTLPCKNKDTLHSMILFYALSDLANCDAAEWYKGTVAHLLYPNASMNSQRISEFLAEIGKDEVTYNFQKKYISFVFSQYDPDRNILVDSSGVPNDIHFDLTRVSNHNGKVSNEIRLALVFQSKTGLPLFYTAVPGNVMDVTTLERIFAHLEAMHVKVDSCIMDAGYNSAANLDMFYANDKKCICDYITRTKCNSKQLTDMVSKALPGLICADNIVQYGNRYLYMVKQTIKVGVDEDKPAFLYLGLDCEQYGLNIIHMCQKAKKEPLTADEVNDIMTNSGFVGFISSHDYSCEEMLPQYYKRQFAEQTFDLMKHYTKLLPVRVQTLETFHGHLLLSYIVSCALRMIQIKMKEAGGFLGSKLRLLLFKPAIVYSDMLVTDWSDADLNEVCTALEIKYPRKIRIKDGRLQYTPPNPDVSGNMYDKINAKKKRGRPAKKTHEQETQQQVLGITQTKRGRGRPKGSKNKKTLGKEAQGQILGTSTTKRGKGRPKGSKNKKTLEREQALSAGTVTTNPI
ncbi:MAG: transposase [Clostridia bacterium]|nr:transposase [Clostridia bacterium]